MVVSMISALARVPVRHDVAMTGEITLTGKVLPVGGIKEKVLAAYRAGIREVILPRENEKDLQEVPEEVKKTMNFLLVENVNQVLDLALVKEELVEIQN
jgi:ATP-dependent Lon protease